MVCTGNVRMCPLLVVSANIFESNGILSANEISCVTPRYYRQKQTALMEGAGPPSSSGTQSSGNTGKTWPEGPGSGAEQTCDQSCRGSSSQHWGAPPAWSKETPRGTFHPGQRVCLDACHVEPGPGCLQPRGGPDTHGEWVTVAGWPCCRSGSQRFWVAGTASAFQMVSADPSRGLGSTAPFRQSPAQSCVRFS